MNSALETDFLNQQQRLAVLEATRDSLEDGSSAAADSDNAIAEVKDLILSYQTLKYYE